MSTEQALTTHLVTALTLLALTGIVCRRRAHLCFSFVAYLVAGFVATLLVTLWPEHFFKTWFWILTHGIFDALRLGIALELAFRTFQAFPQAQGTARRLLFLLVAGTGVALVGIPVVSDAGRVLLDWQPRVLTGTIWVMNGVAILITWYRVPVHAYHKALLLGFVPYLLTFTTLLSLLKQWGWGFLPYVQALEPLAFMVLMGFWAWSAWRDEKEPEASPAVIHLLQPWRA